MNRRDLIDALKAEDFSPYYRLADKIRFQEKGNYVDIRAILEFSNICRRKCVYCGLNCRNQALHRYRMTPDEIVDTASAAARAGYRTLVMQSGEDPWFTPKILGGLVKEIKKTGMAVTLSCGEMPEEAYAYLRECGADRYLRYLDALDAENEGELDSALDIYVSLGSFEDCAERAQTLEAAIPEQAIRQGRQLMSQGDYEGARDLFLSLNGYGQSRALSDACTAAIARKAYLAAEDLLGAGDYLGAMNAFAAMGDTLDAAHRAEECRLLLLKQAEEAFQAVTLETADALDEQLESLSADAAFAEIRQALAEKFGVNLSLLRAARSEHPYVLLGTYPMGESGAESDVLWQVLRVDGNQLVLLCCSVIDASSVATTSDLPMADTPDAAEISLPSAADLATLTDLTCAATPYAAAQGASAVYWLRDTLESGIHPVISETGSLTLPADTEVPGIRPLALLDLTAYVFTAGDGTEENPYR